MGNDRKMFVFLLVCTALTVLYVRIFYLQIIEGSKLAKSASVQRYANSVIEKPRGNILDRNGIPFTNRTKKSLIVVKPLYLRGKEEEILALCNILGIDFNKTRREIEIKKEPIVIETDDITKDKILQSNIQGISIINYLERYDDNLLARHVIGYLNNTDKTGEFGIEKAYEDVLKFGSNNTVGVITDAKRTPIEGLGYRLVAGVNKTKGMNVKLTLDYHIQKIVDDVLGKSGVSGAVVVEEVCTGDIVAISSKPDFDSKNLGQYLDSPRKELYNRAVASYNMGSTFKIIDAAEALESNVELDTSFFCGGSIKVGNKVFHCHKTSGHGILDLRKAFASSCNPYFIDLGIKIGRKNLLDMAVKFGLGSATGIKDQGINESSGRLQSENRVYTYGDTANLSIGQGEVLVTPVQVADVVATVANGGIKNRVNIVDSVVDDSGAVLKKVGMMREKE